jgi:hypothetical protein
MNHHPVRHAAKGPDPQEVQKAIKARLEGPGPQLFDWTEVDEAIHAEADGTKDISPRPYVVIRALVPALGILVSPYGDDPGFAPSTTYVQGFTQAMRDLWSSVTDGTSGGTN